MKGIRKSSLFPVVAAVVCLGVVFASPVAHAWKIVFDPSVFAKVIAVIAQLVRIYNLLARWLDLEAINLEKLELELEDPNLDLLEKMELLLEEARIIQYKFDEISDIFAEVYPDFDTVNLVDLTENYIQWILAQKETARDAMQAQATLEDLVIDRRDINEILEASRAAAGHMQAFQANNEMLAVVAKQLMRLENQSAMSHRQISAEKAQKASEQQASLKIRQQMFETWEDKAKNTYESRHGRRILGGE